MTTRTLQTIALLLGLALGGNAIACSCARLPDETFFNDLFARADTIVHARIVDLLNSHEARIEVIESFKGHPTVLKALSLDEGMCGIKFRVGDEAIFVSHLGHVSSCGRISYSLELIEGLRAHKR